MAKHILNRIGLESNIKRKVKVYDVEKKKLIYEFDSVAEASKFLGVKNVAAYINQKCKSYKNNLGITICFR
jgi:hypothetical protein